MDRSVDPCNFFELQALSDGAINDNQRLFLSKVISMLLVRAVRIDDLDDLLRLVRSATQGLTSLQLNREQLLDRIEQSVFAMSRTGVAARRTLRLGDGRRFERD